MALDMVQKVVNSIGLLINKLYTCIAFSPIHLSIKNIYGHELCYLKFLYQHTLVEFVNRFG